MTHQTPHEPNAPVMSAADVWEDSETLAQVLRNRLRSELADRGEIPFPAFLAAIEPFREGVVLSCEFRCGEKVGHSMTPLPAIRDALLRQKLEWLKLAE